MLDVDPKSTQQINFTENLDLDNGPRKFSITEEEKKTILDFSPGTVEIF